MGNVRCQVGAVYQRFADGRSVPIVPIVEVCFPWSGPGKTDVKMPGYLSIGARASSGGKLRVVVRPVASPDGVLPPRGGSFLDFDGVEAESWAAFDRLRSL